MSTPLLNQACHQNASAWQLLGLIEDLDISSSAKNMQQSGRKMEKGCTMHDYHKILTVILQELIWHTAGWGNLLIHSYGRRDMPSQGDPNDVSHHWQCQEWQQPVLSVHGQELQRQGPTALHDFP
jgi:hypothetical protein